MGLHFSIHRSVPRSSASLAKLTRPILKLLETLLTYRWSDRLQASLKVLELYWAYLVHGHRQELLTQ
jgi:hypothetical protein